MCGHFEEELDGLWWLLENIHLEKIRWCITYISCAYQTNKLSDEKNLSTRIGLGWVGMWCDGFIPWYVGISIHLENFS